MLILKSWKGWCCKRSCCYHRDREHCRRLLPTVTAGHSCPAAPRLITSKRKLRSCHEKSYLLTPELPNLAKVIIALSKCISYQEPQWSQWHVLGLQEGAWKEVGMNASCHKESGISFPLYRSENRGMGSLTCSKSHTTRFKIRSIWFRTRPF